MIEDQKNNEGWPDSAGQFDVHKVTSADLDRWEETARFEAWRVELGHFNWPGAMRSLIAEVRNLRNRTKELEAAKTDLEERLEEAQWAVMGDDL